MEKAVIGLGFGDEGKGVLTDYLCSQTKGHRLVVRYCGGHQAGHTVELNGVRHVFSNFGSGSLRGVPTYWSKYCTIDPVGILKELTLLRKEGCEPILYIDPRCPVTTPYDKLRNITSHEILASGTCGVGFSPTLQREEDFFSLTAMDLLYPSILKIKLELISQYYKFHNDELVEALTHFNSACDTIPKEMNIKIEEVFLGGSNVIFEGSQGLLLDQNIGFFPHVTRSNTGLTRLRQLEACPEIFLVTRAYQTRHGNGPMTNTHIPHNIIRDVKETNVTHKYQGEFRISILDADLLKYAVEKDGIRNSHLAITCLEHISGKYQFTQGGELREFDTAQEFGEALMKITGSYDVMLFCSHVRV